MTRGPSHPELGYVCVHGHFYQPPRENPWIEEVEPDPSAHPHHDWNQRIQAECYRPNRAARLLSPGGCIRRVVNNYEAMSFNFGPTLLAWMERFDPETYAAIVAADRPGGSGPGRALAQAYNHAILPLCNSRDKRTQVLWGIADFQHRFGRPPQGLWLPETAVDVETLEILAEVGIRFTVLAPHQAEAVRGPGDSDFRPVGEADPGWAYRAPLPSGQDLAVLFYDGPASRAVAFERLLDDGARLADRLLDPLLRRPGEGRLSHIATDGETYGHHHRFGEMALAFALERLDRDPRVRRVTYGEYLELHPPVREVRIRENTSWSCAHGVERWRRHCGCATGAHPGWRQDWREPLRAAFDHLRDWAAPRFEAEASRWLRDPWAARDDYIGVLLKPDPAVRGEFLRAHARGDLDEAARRRVWRLLELQRHAMLMFTSCGWFFDDVSGVETQQVLSYAAMVVESAERLFGEGPGAAFFRLLGEARSNRRNQGSARSILRSVHRRRRADVPRLAAGVAAGRVLAPTQFEGFPFSHELSVQARELDVAGGEEEAASPRERQCRITGTSRRTEEPLCAEVLVRLFHPASSPRAIRTRPKAGGAFGPPLRVPLSTVVLAGCPGDPPAGDETHAGSRSLSFGVPDLLDEVQWRLAWFWTRRARRHFYRRVVTWCRSLGLPPEQVMGTMRRRHAPAWLRHLAAGTSEAWCYELLSRRPPAWDEALALLPSLAPASVLEEPSPLLEALEAAALEALRAALADPGDGKTWGTAASFLAASRPLLRPGLWWDLQNVFIGWAASGPRGTPGERPASLARALSVCWPFPPGDPGEGEP